MVYVYTMCKLSSERTIERKKKKKITAHRRLLDWHRFQRETLIELSAISRFTFSARNCITILIKLLKNVQLFNPSFSFSQANPTFRYFFFFLVIFFFLLLPIIVRYQRLLKIFPSSSFQQLFLLFFFFFSSYSNETEEKWKKEKLHASLKYNEYFLFLARPCKNWGVKWKVG